MVVRLLILAFQLFGLHDDGVEEPIAPMGPLARPIPTDAVEVLALRAATSTPHSLAVVASLRGGVAPGVPPVFVTGDAHRAAVVAVGYAVRIGCAVRA